MAAVHLRFKEGRGFVAEDDGSNRWVRDVPWPGAQAGWVAAFCRYVIRKQWVVPVRASRFHAARVRNVSRLRSQLSKPGPGFELDLTQPSWSSRIGAVRAILKQPRELFHRKPSLSDQRPKSPFGKFFVVWNGEASIRRIGTPQNDVAPVLLIKFVSGFSECLDCLAAGNNR